MADSELGVFLRGCREAVAPTEVGLRAGTRRRTPGLRRAELATLAGISVEYLTRLEQGRDRNPSVQVLGALADALRLSTDERFHLRRLAKEIGGGIGLCPAAIAEPARSVRPTVRALLEALEPSPAMLVNRISEVLACTSGYRRLVEPIGLLDDQPPSLIRFVFADARARAAYPEWDQVADELVASLRIESASGDPFVADLADELTITAGAAFADRMANAAALPARTGVQRLVHPEVGDLRLAYETLDVSDVDNQRLIVYLPATETTSSALARLTGRRPGALHAVPG